MAPTGKARVQLERGLGQAANIRARTIAQFLLPTARYDPSTGFTAPPAECDDEYSLVWRFGDAPPVLVQGVVDYETGGAMDPATLIAPTAIELVGDQTTVYFLSLIHISEPTRPY